MILNIEKRGSPVLHSECVDLTPSEIKDERLARLVMDMLETAKHHDGIGLAANQVGVNKNLFIVTLGDNLQLALINPKILKATNWATKEEGCLSVPDENFLVSRARKIRIEFTNLNNEKMQLDVDDHLIARVIQHEVDHLKGILICDK
jgi:peptide deformylase